MATLDPGNIVNGNIIQTSDLLQLYKAFGTGSGDTITGLAMTGSLNGTASWADSSTNSTIAVSASNLTTATTSSGVYYPVVVSGVGTKPPKLVSTFELSGSVLNNITASRAITASYALNAATPSNTVTVSAGSGETNPLGDFSMKAFAGITDAFIGGGLPNSQSVSMSLAFPTLTPSTAIGTDLWVNATPLTADINITQPIFVSYNPASKVLTFQTEDATFNGQVVYTGYAK